MLAPALHTQSQENSPNDSGSSRSNSLQMTHTQNILSATGRARGPKLTSQNHTRLSFLSKLLQVSTWAFIYEEGSSLQSFVPLKVFALRSDSLAPPLYDLEQVTLPLCILFLLPIKWDDKSTYFRNFREN